MKLASVLFVFAVLSGLCACLPANLGPWKEIIPSSVLSASQNSLRHRIILFGKIDQGALDASFAELYPVKRRPFFTAEEVSARVGTGPALVRVARGLFPEGDSQGPCGHDSVVVTPNRIGTAVVVEAARECIEAAFAVKLSVFENSRTGRRLLRTRDAYVNPAGVDLVLGLGDLSPLRRIGGNRRNRAPARRARPAGFRSAKPAAAANAPVIDVERGLPEGASNITVTFFCEDGTSPTASSPFCQNPVVTGFAVSTGDELGVSRSVTVPTSSAFCAQPGTCIIRISQPEYSFTTVTSLAAVYSNGLQSQPTAGFPVISSPQVLPTTLQQLYNIPVGTFATNPGATQSVPEFEEQYYSPSDLSEFLTGLGLPSTPVSVFGYNDPSQPGGEADLDIQWIMAMAPLAPTTFISNFQNSTLQVDDILSWQLLVTNMTTPPLVHSVSYGMPEQYVDAWLGSGYLAKSDAHFQIMALLGLTVVIACGDTGVFDDVDPITHGCNGGVLRPDWPSQSPYVIAVGSTYITPLSEPACYQRGGPDCRNGALGEVSVSVDMGMRWTTGGGFSQVNPRPAYQDAAVSAYLSQQASIPFPSSANFNSKGRAYPDVATVGHNLAVVLAGQWVSIDGTSASAPIWAGMLTLINSRLLDLGMEPMGFINHHLYELELTFRDVTVGSNRCGSYGLKEVCCPFNGFRATTGWDAVSGLGTPGNFVALRDQLIELIKARTQH